MANNKTYNYNWNGYEAQVFPHPRRKNEWKWNVESIDDDYTSFQSHIDIELDSPEYAEQDMLNEIRTHLGTEPESQVNKSL